MRDTNLQNPDGSKRTLHIPEVFPDLATCRVKRASIADYFDCLSFWTSSCPHSVYFASSRYCRHPSAPEIFARSEANQDKPA